MADQQLGLRSIVCVPFLMLSLFIFRCQLPAGPKADWNRAVMSNRVMTPVRLLNWAVIYPLRFEADVRKFVDMIGSCAQKTGIEIARPKVS